MLLEVASSGQVRKCTLFVEVILGIPVFMWGSKTKGLFILMIFYIVFKLQQLKQQRKRESLEKYSGMCAHTHSHTKVSVL